LVATHSKDVSFIHSFIHSFSYSFIDPMKLNWLVASAGVKSVYQLFIRDMRAS